MERRRQPRAAPSPLRHRPSAVAVPRAAPGPRAHRARAGRRISALVISAVFFLGVPDAHAAPARPAAWPQRLGGYGHHGGFPAVPGEPGSRDVGHLLQNVRSVRCRDHCDQHQQDYRVPLDPQGRCRRSGSVPVSLDIPGQEATRASRARATSHFAAAAACRATANGSSGRQCLLIMVKSTATITFWATCTPTRPASSQRAGSCRMPGCG